MTKNDYEQLAKIPLPNVFSSFDPFSVGFDKTFKALASQLDGIGKASRLSTLQHQESRRR